MAGSVLVKAGSKSAKRLWDDITGIPKKVRAAKGTKGQPEGVGTSAKDRKKGAAHQNQPKAKAARKVEMSDAANLRQPAGGRATRTADMADSDLPSGKRAAFKANEWDKALEKKEKELETYKKKLASLTGAPKVHFKSKNKQRIESLKNSIADMKKRKGPRVNKRKTGGQVMKKSTGEQAKKKAQGKKVAAADWMQGLSQKEIDEILGNPTRDASGVKRHTKRKKNKPHKKKVVMRTAKAGGKVVKKAGGGKMSHVGLYPAEESRSGTMSEMKRAKNMKSGGKVKKYGHGGQVKHNTSRENRLEELGRVDAEKAYTKKGKSNLRSEKKRIVKELNGNDFVARHYD
jgi:hypothetical protein